MAFDVQEFKKEFQKKFEELFAYGYESGSKTEQYIALGDLVRGLYSDDWIQTVTDYNKKKEKQVFYFSMEFLPGRMLKSNLLNMGIMDCVKQGLEELGLDLDEVARAEVDPALGNGGLGRLASCFMDSIASTGLAGNGNGIRYRYGLFKQKFINGYQIELPENWLRNRNVWEVRKENKAVIVRFGGDVSFTQDGDGKLRVHHENTRDILAVPYDPAQIGYNNGIINNLRLWSAEIPYGDEARFLQKNSARKSNASLRYCIRTIPIMRADFCASNRILLLFCRRQSIVRYFKQLKLDWSLFPDKIAIHINDTHPTLAIPELMRILLDEEELTWDQAWEITKKTVSYTNHTILQEAMERWPETMIADLLPRIYQIIQEINRRHIDKKMPLYGEELTQRTAIIANGQIKMANLAIIGSHSVNGVAKLHSDILMADTLHDFYVMYPQKFNNKTNGITQRRWVQIANENLTEMLDETIGTEWKSDPEEIKVLKAHRDNKIVLDKLEQVKLANKKRFADYVLKEMHIEIDPNALFDVQIKRLHAYKRQLLNVLHILDRYLQLKDDPKANLQKRVFIFGAQAAPSYYYAKQIIKLINAIADLVNNDPAINDKIKIVFVENYGVSLAELIIPAADISEQISLAGKEASGTSNMKLMSNGAVTMATLDGANVEIRDNVGDENIFIFGLKSDEVQEYYRNGVYNSREIYEKNPRLKRILNLLIDGSIPGVETEGRDIFDSLVMYNDEYFLLKDFDGYLQAQYEADVAFSDRDRWNRMALMNIASSGPFSSDYTILRYADEIWKIKPQS